MPNGTTMNGKPLVEKDGGLWISRWIRHVDCGQSWCIRRRGMCRNKQHEGKL